MARVGVLAGGGPTFQPGLEAFRQRLRELGYEEGRTIALEIRNAEGRDERYLEFAAELVRLRVDVIVAQGNPAVVALKRATQTTPIVMAVVGDPVGSGFVASLPRPGGNITGLSNMAEGISTKWVELLKEAAPKATRFGVLMVPATAAHTSMWEEIQRAGRALRVMTKAWEVRGSEDIDRAFAAMGPEGVGALIVLPHPVTSVNQRQILGLLIKHRLPAIRMFQDFPEAGGLMSYGPKIANLWRDAARFVDKILKGAKPADLPVEQPMRFELVVNMKTARALGLALPPTIMVRADQVIE
jgi:putative ABC transport system substrate-binding protein